MKRQQRKKGGVVLPDLAQPERQVPRRLRLEGDLQERLTLAMRALEDPRLIGVAVGRVEMTDDLQLVRVFVYKSLRLGSDAVSEEERRDVMRGLRAASGRLRRDVAGALSLRYTPDLRFLYDDGRDNTRRVDELLEEIKRDGG